MHDGSGPEALKKGIERENILFKCCLRGLGKCNSVGAVFWHFHNSSLCIRGQMKLFSSNQKQLIKNQWELYQLFETGTQGAEVPKTG